ncbi:MAG TPA: arsenosugar biosynthesis radical SAM (seleno)protein ArsS [Nitrospirota bacterium]
MRFHDKVLSVRNEPLTSRGITVLQVNMGYQCNMACRHCHVSAGPGRAEMMDRKTVDDVLSVVRGNAIGTLDLTGGAPELNPHFRALVSAARAAGKRVISRTNLTIFFEKGMHDLPEFYQKQGVELIASLPCYREDNVDRLRGDGVYQKSIEALRRLNRLGYGVEPGGLRLSLVYNPAGEFLAPPQCALEADYKRVLKERHGIVFTRLFAFANMPIGRFRTALAEKGNLDAYLEMLVSAFNPATLDNIMCRSIVSVGWDGSLYDCDFNQMLGLGASPDAPRHIRDFDFNALSRRTIVTDDHCFGCTAGQGST